VTVPAGIDARAGRARAGPLSRNGFDGLDNFLARRWQSERAAVYPARSMEPTETPPKRAPGEILREIRKLLAPEGTRTLTQAKLAEQLGYNERIPPVHGVGTEADATPCRRQGGSTARRGKIPRCL